MLKSLHIRNFTVFDEAKFEFGPGLNILVGANGTGKSHALKLGYAIGVASVEITIAQRNNQPAYDKTDSPSDALRDVFRVNDLWALRRNVTEGEVTIETAYEQPAARLFFHFSSLGPGSPVGMGLDASTTQLTAAPLFIPAKEVLSFYEGFSALYRKYNIAFDQTYLDLCEALSGPTLREPGPSIQAVLASLERLMQGRVALEGGRFYLYPAHGERQEINLAAEGIRKFATLAQLLANGSLTTETTLFWDEPEANLNPALLRELAHLLVQLADQGFQIIIATHSLFLLREFHILAQQQPMKPRYFGLNAQPDGATQVATADDLTLLPDIVALDAELAQSDIFMDVLNASDDEV